jgi:hypothetical protein
VLIESGTDGTGEMVSEGWGVVSRKSETDGTGEMVSEWWWVVN